MTKTIAQLNKEIAALQAEAKRLYAVELKGVVAKVNEMIAKHSLSPADLKFSGNAAVVSKSPSVKSTPGEARYGDGKGNTWGGRGPRPAWLRSALEAGGSLESFLRTGGSVAEMPQPALASQPKAGRAIGKRPAKFKDAHGNSWSGRGSRPRWLQAALKKRGAKIEDFLIDRADLPLTTSSATAAPAAPKAKKSSPSTTQQPGAKPARAAKAKSVDTGGSKGSSSSVQRVESSKTASKSASAHVIAGPHAVKSKPIAKNAAKKRDRSVGAKVTVKPSTAASVAKSPVKAASVPAAKKSAIRAPAKKAVAKKSASKATKRPAVTKRVMGQADSPPGLSTAAPVAPSEALTLVS